MLPSGSVTGWLERLQRGDGEVAQEIWDRYFRRLVGLAREYLHTTRRRVADEEDMAICAFHSFFRGVERGRFPQLSDRDDLWKLLVSLTIRKTRRHLRDSGRLKRSGDVVVPMNLLEEIASPEPTPELAALVADECRRLLTALGDEQLRQIALWKMEGDTNAEIAAKLGCALATVERRLALTRRIWEREGTS